jgi:hypothetical protein
MIKKLWLVITGRAYVVVKPPISTVPSYPAPTPKLETARELVKRHMSDRPKLTTYQASKQNALDEHSRRLARAFKESDRLIMESTKRYGK